MYKLLKKTEANEYYSVYYPKILSYWQKHGHEPRPLILKRLNIKNKKVLDIGCGNGLMLKDLVKENEVYGVDISKDLLDQAKLMGIKTKLFNFDKDDKLPFPEKYFDVLLMFEAIEHSFNPASLLGKSKRVLDTKGVIYLTIPNRDYPNRIGIIQNSLKSALKNTYKGKVPPKAKRFPDVNILTIKQIQKMAKKVGLEITEVNGWSWLWEEMKDKEREYLWNNAMKAEDLLLTLRL